MSKEIELGHVAVTDRRGRSSYLILTNYRIYHHKEGSIFGSSKTFIPHEAITSVQLGWRRLWWILALGLILLAICIFSMVQGLESLLQYGLLLGSLSMFLLFWFYRTSDIQIMSPTETLGGSPDNYDDGRKFCELLLSALDEDAAGDTEGAVKTSRKSASEAEWRL
jgi:hypothetical protein